MNLLDRNIRQSDFVDFCKKLQHQLLQDLPGKEAQMKMSSRVRAEELGFNQETGKAKPSSVLIFLYPVQNKICTSFILRTKYDGVHSGQISFPGGRMEKNDGSLINTALREAHEEVNINPANTKILGTLSDMYIPPSNFMVTPVVAYAYSKPEFKPQTSEVEEIIEADISFLFNESLKKRKLIYVRNHKIEAPYYDVNGNIIWGATAMILSELKEVIERIS